MIAQLQLYPTLRHQHQCTLCTAVVSCMIEDCRREVWGATCDRHWGDEIEQSPRLDIEEIIG